MIKAGPVFAGLAALAAYFYFSRRMKKDGFSEDAVWGIILCALPFSVVCSILYYCLFFGHSSSGNFAVFLIRHALPGGAFFGSFWGAFLGLWAYCAVKKISWLAPADAMAMASMPALCVMKIGCFMHGCCYGAPAGNFLGVVFPDPHSAIARSLLGRPVYPVQLYESAAALAIFFAAGFLAGGAKPGRRAGSQFFWVGIIYSFARFFIDFFRGGDEGRILLPFVTFSQFTWLFCGTALVLWNLRRRSEK